MDLDLTKHLKKASAHPEAATKEAKPLEQPTIVYERKVDAQGRSRATGKRKCAIIRVWLKEGKGLFTVNGSKALDYFTRKAHQMVLESPFVSISRPSSKFDIVATAEGGGVTGQAEALRLGISKALVCLDPSTRSSLKSAGFLRRDNRIVERKKFGQKKARKRFQFSKR